MGRERRCWDSTVDELPALISHSSLVEPTCRNCLSCAQGSCSETSLSCRVTRKRSSSSLRADRWRRRTCGGRRAAEG